MSGVAASSGSAGGSGTPLGGLGGSLEDKDCELVCPVCFDLIEEAYVTRCGHSFCFACIAKAVEVQRRCPKCGAALAGRDHIFPNFLLNELVNARRLRTRPNTATPPPGSSGQRLAAMLQAESARLDLPHVTSMLSVLTRRKRALEAESQAAQNRLLYEFLSHLHQHRKHQLEQLEREAALVEKDMEQVAASLKELNASTESLLLEPSTSQDTARRAKQDTFSSSSPTVPEEEESFGSAGASAGDALAARWRLLTQHFEDFVQCYFSHRSSSLYFGAPSAAPAPPAPLTNPEADSVPEVSAHDNGNGDQRAPEADTDLPPPERIRDRTRPAEREPQGLDAFKEDLVAFTRYRSLRPLATLSYCSDAINYSTIVSTIEFDKDEEFFAIAGVTKRIKVFEFESVVRDAVDVHYPCAEMQCTHKISCVSWNAYHKHILASSDYEGTVSVWDAATGQRTRALQEHDKRCWSVHFNQCDVRLLASGSDDARVKLWALNHERSVATLDAKYNVCCVRFNGGSSAHLAFGSADHCVHYYDLRSPRAPLGVFRDHRKAVSYVKFVSSRKLVSASTDSQLKLWSVDRPRHIRSFTGHANEKNFVGLATDGKYIACGSENNALYVYYSGLSKPLLSYKFDAVRGFLEKERRDEEPSEFVSAVCWRKAADRQILLAANSQGIIKVLELV